MSSLRPPHQHQTHRCQIDCSNHDEVINALQLKSKDLYYFWRNYEWLYTRYMNEQQQQPKEPIIKIQNNHDQYQKQIQRLQIENEGLKKENKSLKMNLQNYKKQLQDLQSNNKYQSQYKLKINSLNAKNGELQSIVEKQLKELNKLKESLRSHDEEFQSQRNNFNKQIKKNRQVIIELQQAIDEMRHKASLNTTQYQSNQNKPEPLSSKEIQEYKYKQTTMITSKFSTLTQQLQKMLTGQCESMKYEFQQRFQQIIIELTQRQLQSLVQVIQE